MRRPATLLLLVLLLWLPAGVASADPAGPTNYRSTLNEVPDVPGVEVSVFGGDSFLVLDVAPGHEVLVYGYRHSEDVLDPYLRVREDGTVEVNRRSPARWLNEDRYQATEVPDFVDASAPPDWEVVASGGSYAWHDHRIHWMSPALPPTIDPDGGVQVVPSLENWSVPLVIDGEEHVLTGTLRWEPSPSPLPWVGVAVLCLLVVAALVRSSGAVGALAVGAGSLVALAAGVGSNLGLPSGVGIVLPAVLLPAVALLVVLLALGRTGVAQRLLAAAAGLPLIGWGITQFGAVTSPIIPTSLSAVVVRAAVAVVMGTAVGAILAAIADQFGSQGHDDRLAALADALDPTDASDA